MEGTASSAESLPSAPNGPESFATKDASASVLGAISGTPTGPANAIALGTVLAMGICNSDLPVSTGSVTSTGKALLRGRPVAAITAEVGTLTVIAADG